MATINKTSSESGIMKPANIDGDAPRAKLITQLTIDELYEELESKDLIAIAKETIKDIELETQVDAFLAIHHEALDANEDRMAQVLNIEPWDVRDRLKELGYIFPEGA